MDAVDTNTLTPEQKTVFDTQVESGILPANAFANVGSITSDSLKASETPVSLPETTPSTTANALSGIAQATAEQIKLAREQERKAREAQNAVSASRNDLTTLMDEITGVQRSQGQLEAEAGIPEKAKRVTDVTNQIEALQRAQVNEIRALEKANMTDAGRASAIRDINRKYAFEQADLALIQSAANRDLTTAQMIVDNKIKLALEPLKTRLEFNQRFYEDNKEKFNKEEDRAFQLATKKLDREYEQEKFTLNQIGEIQLALAKNGAPASVISGVGNAKTLGEAFTASGSWLLPRTSGAPTVKTINGVDMQWNPSTQQWDSIGPAVENDRKASDQLAFLRETAKEANALADASGASGLSKLIGDQLIGDTKFRQLEAQTNTLRTNVLTLMTDPSIKKFFGPQMSEADVRLMTAAGTTLNPENQSPKQLKAEIKRLDELFERMQKAVSVGATGDTLTKSGKSFDIQAARAAGYSEQEIQDFINSN